MELNAQQKELAEEIDEEFSEELAEEENTVEALLFTMGNSVSLEQIAAALDLSKEAANAAAVRLMERYQKRNGGMLIRCLEDRYQMCTNPAYYESLIRVARQPRKPVLTDVIMETLSIIAYKQPVTKAEIEKIRGVSSDHAVNRLVEFNLVYEVGRLDAPGRPALFATTEDFLRRFGVSSLQELPGLNPETEAEIQSEVNEEVTDLMGAASIPDDAEETAEDLEERDEAETETAAEEQGIKEVQDAAEEQDTAETDKETGGETDGKNNQN